MEDAAAVKRYLETVLKRFMADTHTKISDVIYADMKELGVLKPREDLDRR